MILFLWVSQHPHGKNILKIIQSMWCVELIEGDGGGKAEME